MKKILIALLMLALSTSAHGWIGSPYRAVPSLDDATGDTITFDNGETIDNSTNGTVAVTATITSVSGSIDVGTNLTTANASIPVITATNEYKYQWSMFSGSNTTNLDVGNGYAGTLVGSTAISVAETPLSGYILFNADNEKARFAINIPHLYNAQAAAATDLELEFNANTNDANDTLVLNAWTVGGTAMALTQIITNETLTIVGGTKAWIKTATYQIGEEVGDTVTSIFFTLEQDSTTDATAEKKVFGARLKYKVGLANPL